MQRINIIIAEDHAPSRKVLSRFIELLPDFRVVEVVADGEELIQQVLTLKPELVLVDINMPRLNGVDAVKECIKMKPGLKFIFVTAYDDYAVEAFNMFATDYVMKPVERNRLFLALERAKQEIVSENRMETRERHKKKVLPIQFKHTHYYIPMKDILFIERVDRKSMIHTNDQQFQTYETLESLKQSLDHTFYQTHRSYIVHIPSIYSISVSGNTFLAHFKNYEHGAFIAKQKINFIRKLIDECINTSG